MLVCLFFSLQLFLWRCGSEAVRMISAGAVLALYAGSSA